MYKHTQYNALYTLHTTVAMLTFSHDKADAENHTTVRIIAVLEFTFGALMVCNLRNTQNMQAQKCI